MWQKNHDCADSLDDSFNEQIVQRAGREDSANARADPVHAVLQEIHRELGEGENALENQRHDRQENQQTPNFVGHDPVELIAEHFSCGRDFGSDGLLDEGDPGVTRFNGRAPPIQAEFFQSLPHRLDRPGDLRRIMRAARSGEFFVAEDQDGLGQRLETRVGKSGL